MPYTMAKANLLVAIEVLHRLAGDVQTSRPDDAGPVRNLRGGGSSPPFLFWRSKCKIRGSAYLPLRFTARR
jgi:hypothetical protein